MGRTHPDGVGRFPDKTKGSQQSKKGGTLPYLVVIKFRKTRTCTDIATSGIPQKSDVYGNRIFRSAPPGRSCLGRTLPGRQIAKKISRSDLRFRQNLWSKVRFPYTRPTWQRTSQKTRGSPQKARGSPQNARRATHPNHTQSDRAYLSLLHAMTFPTWRSTWGTLPGSQTRCGRGSCSGGGCDSSGVRFTSLPPPGSAQTSRLSSAHTVPNTSFKTPTPMLQAQP